MEMRDVVEEGGVERERGGCCISMIIRVVLEVMRRREGWVEGGRVRILVRGERYTQKVTTRVDRGDECMVRESAERR